MKKSLVFIILLNFFFSSANSIEPDEFVQSTVNRASEVLSKNISKEEKIKGLKIIAKETVDIRGVGFYSLGSARKDLNDSQKIHTPEEDYKPNKVDESEIKKYQEQRAAAVSMQRNAPMTN